MDKESKINANLTNIFILKSLESGEKYGYEIIDSVTSLSNNKVQIKQATLYTNLKKLEQKKYINSYWKDSEIGGKRHYYFITETGLKYLSEAKIDTDNSNKQDTTIDDKANNDNVVNENIEIIDANATNTTNTKAYWAENKYFASKMLDPSINNPLEKPKKKNVEIQQSTEIPNVEEEKVEHKCDASLLRSDEVIPSSYEAISMENRPINSASFKTTDLDYKSILGELYSTKEDIKNNKQPQNNVDNNYNLTQNNVDDDVADNDYVEQKSFTVVDDNIVKESNYETDFSKYKIKVKPHNKLYKIYDNTGEFLKSNRLNFFQSIFMFGFISLLILICGLTTSKLISSAGTICIILFAIALAYPVTMFIIYRNNRSKKTRNNFNFLNNILITILLSLVVMIFAISICFLCGMTNLNQGKYVFYWVIPAIMCLSLVAYPIIKYLLIKSKRFDC